MIKLVIAGPGTGKTTFITNEIRKLLEKGVDPSQILALTFTDKAAQEMLGRLDEAMPLGYEPPWISTFHSFCDRILRQEGLEIGLDPAYKILSEPEAWLLLRQHLYDLPLDYYRPLGNPTKFISALLNLFSRAKDEEVTPDDYFKWALRLRSGSSTKEEKEEAKKQTELAKVYEACQKLLLKNSDLDFGDLILWTIKLFKDRPNILQKYRQQFRHIFVDEFQDTNSAQFSLIKLLVPGRSVVQSSNLTVVGDDDQAIYKWRGASVSNILEFKKTYPSCRTHVLSTSYRLTDTLAQRSYRMIKNNNPDRLEVKLKNVSKKLKTLKTGPAPTLLYARSAEEETELVLRKIVELINTEGKNFSDFAILARANAHLDPFIAALKRHELPFQIVGNRGLFEQEEVAALLAVLRVIKDPTDNISWYKILNIPAFKIPPERTLQLFVVAQKESIPLAEILAREKIKALDVIHDLAKDAFRVSPSHLLFDFVRKSGYIKNLEEPPTLENQLKIENIALFFQKIQQFEAEVKEPNVPELVDYLDLLIEAGESPAQAVIEDVDTINLMTVHAAKGLEFPVVFLVSLTADRFPTRQRSAALELPEHFVKEFRYLKKSHKEDAERVGHQQEERRLFYVGATRASEQLFLSYAQSYGGVRDKRPSPFIFELGLEVSSEPQAGSPIETLPVREPEKELDLKRFIPEKLSYSQLEDYKTCPWKYRYKYVLRLPSPPTPPTSFGISLHETLREFELRRIKGEKVALGQFLKMYREHFLAGGYRDRKEKEAYFQRGKKLLTDFYRKYQQKLFPPWMVEKGFEIKLGGKTIAGRIDRIGKNAAGEFELIDFKGGETGQKEEEQLAKKAQKDDQLFLYTLAAKEALGINPKSVVLFYLEGGKRIEASFSEEEIQKRTAEIEGRIQKIVRGDFKATPGPQCVWCPFNQICEFSQSDRYR
uniref:DNA 3'-5' helicase n=1 Tax=candidate division WWE3 bacterium TaxID=2053526 RepID=A0A832E0R8_UNCKA